MNNIPGLVTEAIIAFLITNIDDLIILLIFFSQLSPNFRRRHIFIGQYLGFAMIIIASLPGFFGSFLVPTAWIGLLGILPIVMGIKQLLNQEAENAEIQSVSTNLQPSVNNSSITNFILSIFTPQTYKVAAITFANGGDNIGIYIPLFSGYNITKLLVVIFIFFLMKTVWYAVAALLVNQTTIAKVLSRYGNKIMPFVLIALGVYIMYERGSFNLLMGFWLT